MACILVVDDDPQICVLLKEWFESKGHKVQSAFNGVEAMCLVQNNPTELVILDILMPEKEGLETIVDLRREFPQLKIIAMSTGGSERTRLNLLDLARRLGAQHTITKPFDLSAINELVEKVLRNGGNARSDEEREDAMAYSGWIREKWIIP